MVTPSQISISNQSLVFESFAEDEKLTVVEVADRVNERLKSEEKLPVSEQTVRRAITGLQKNGFLREYGKRENAVLYGKLSASWVDSKGDEKLINLAGISVSVGEFLELVVDEEANPYPFVVKVKPENWAISNVFHRKLRKRLAWVVMSASDAGYSEHLKTQLSFLRNHITELQHVVQVMESFTNSLVWHAQYRDRIAGELRKLQEKRPELLKLANDYIKDK